jgi:lipoprotein-anchoring transpeptidase ErfK/SrfK
MWGALALIAGAALLLAACSSGTSGKPVPTVTVTASGSTSAGASTSASTSSSAAPKPGKPVHVSLNIGDGAEVGVGMPIIATFKVKVRSAVAFQKATAVTVNDAPAVGRWYFEYSDPASGHVMEAHYRLQNYWPAHARIHMDLPVKGLSAGPGLSFENSLTLDFATGAANISVVDDSTHTISVTSDGKPWGKFPVSLGATNTPTARGTKVIMEKGRSICMSGPGYHECGVKYTQRLTYGGEYLHAAPWNTANIGRADSSNGCTNLTTTDALKLYKVLQIGDVVTYPNANGPRMQLGQGYGDWNVPWSLWQTGGAVSTG